MNKNCNSVEAASELNRESDRIATELKWAREQLK